ncbi:TetR/AcrR family transcriptional regulator [Martelella alba]|uniref:TetR/AcrR family transcriptional regulator n=2 Tax=Martelella alba TaxID=2590451 RepID=A0A506U4C0_9HYPH|nr:TetR/AcrR family transcriptional regulator [Martelella alba]
MRVSREQVEENRKTLLTAAGRLFRARGFDAVSVAEVMKEAGLTHGGFYGYFKNKDDLIGQAMAAVFETAETSPQEPERLLAQYLSPQHRDDPGRGCPMAALAGETIRQPGGVRAEMTAGLRRQLAALAGSLPGADEAARHRAAVGIWSGMVGALMLSRMSDDPALSDDILSEARAWLTEALPEALPGGAAQRT